LGTETAAPGLSVEDQGLNQEAIMAITPILTYTAQFVVSLVTATVLVNTAEKLHSEWLDRRLAEQEKKEHTAAVLAAVQAQHPDIVFSARPA
jgi:hypothetical protein